MPRPLFCMLLAAAILHAPCATATAGTVPTAMCFEHIGPQDKPMPGFCVSGPDDVASPQAMALDRARWREFVGFVAREGRAKLAPGRAAEFGLYAVRPQPPGCVLYLAPGAMRALAAWLGAGTGLSAADEDLMQRLRARLRP